VRACGWDASVGSGARRAGTDIETPGGSYRLKGGSRNAELLIESETDPDDITRLRLIDGPERALSS
jgi:hypothetical protein